jgi:hypothetical protein
LAITHKKERAIALFQKHAIESLPETKKPGFCDHLGITTEIFVKKPGF